MTEDRTIVHTSLTWLISGYGLGALLLASLLALSGATHAQSATEEEGTATAGVSRGTVTGLPVPRFVSLKASRVNIRRGPSRTHQVDWVLQQVGLPVEVTAEFENWRRVRDFEGDEGWVYHTLLSGRRTVMVAPWSTSENHDLRAKATDEAAIVARVQPRVVADVETCREGWCRIAVADIKGWMTQDQLFGVYPEEEPGS